MKNYKICDTCEGKGFVLERGHGAFGEPESWKSICCICGGHGFTISKEKLDKIRNKLGLATEKLER